MPCPSCTLPGPEILCDPCARWALGIHEVDDDAAISLVAAIVARARLDLRTRWKTINVAPHGEYRGKRVPVICPAGPEPHRAARCALPVIVEAVSGLERGELTEAAMRLLDDARPDPYPPLVVLRGVPMEGRPVRGHRPRRSEPERRRRDARLRRSASSG